MRFSRMNVWNQLKHHLAPALVFCTVSLGLFGMSQRSFAQEPCEEFLEALRDERLFDVAIDYLDEMVDSPLSDKAFKDRVVAVWGAGKSGIAASNLLADLGATVILSEMSDPRDLYTLEGVDPRVEVRGGGNVLAGADLLIPSPGIKPSTPAMARCGSGITPS